MIYVGGILNREQRGHGRGSCFIHPCAVINGFWGSFFTIGELIFKATQNGLDLKKIFEYLSGGHYVSINSRMFG